MKIVQFLN